MQSNIQCVVCCESIRHIPGSSSSNSTFEKLFQVFCKYMNLNSTDLTDFNFLKEPFPFCDMCKLKLAGILQLNELLESLQNQIQVQVLNLTVKLLESKGPDEDAEPDGSVFEDKNKIVLFRKNQAVMNGKPVETVQVSVGRPRLSPFETTRLKISRLRKKIQSRYKAFVTLEKLSTVGETKSIQIDLKPKVSRCSPVRTREIQLKEESRVTMAITQHHGETEDGVPPDLDFSDLPMDDEFVFDHQELESVLEKEVPPTPSKVIPGDNLGVGMEVEVSSIADPDDDGLGSTYSPPPADDTQPERENEEEPQEPPEMPQPPEIKEMNNTKYIPVQMFSIIESSPGVFLFGDRFSFRHDEEAELYSCGECTYGCKRRPQILKHMRLEHAFNTSNDDSFFDNGNSHDESVKDSSQPTKYFPLNLNRTYELSPGKFVYADKFAFERRGDTFWCESCGVTSATKARMLRHLRYNHFYADRYKCPTCDKTFSEAGKLRCHLDLHTETPQHVCEECGKTCKTQKLLKLHKANHAAKSEPRFICDQCGKQFVFNSALQAHLSWHAGYFSCPVCGDKFSERKTLMLHQAIHKKGRQKCTQCDGEFLSEKTLLEHVSMVHSAAEQADVSAAVEAIIEEPGPGAVETVKLESSSDNRTSGTKENNSEPKEGFPCTLCEKVLKSRKNLIDHVRCHQEDPRQFRCKICGKECRKKANVRSHIRGIHGAKYVTRNDDFVEDLRENPPPMGRKPTREPRQRKNRPEVIEYNEDGTPKGHPCEKCNMVLKTKKYLKDHMLIHDGIKNYHCELCGKAIRKRFNFRMHMKTVHKVIVPLQDRRFKSAKSKAKAKAAEREPSTEESSNGSDSDAQC